MLTTTNYGLKKPEGTDVVNIDDFNGNADIIDTKLKEINSALPLKAPLDSPGLTGAPTAPTQTPGDNSTKIANTAFVTIAIANKTSVSGNAGTATKLQTPRNIALAGDVTGSANFDGSGNISITTTVADDSHNHIIANVDGLQSALDVIDTHLSDMMKQSKANINYYVDVTNGNDNNDGLTSGTSFKTISKALSILPPIIKHAVTIICTPGTYNEDISISDFLGRGYIQLKSSNATQVTVNSISIINCETYINITSFNVISTSKSNIIINNCEYVVIDGCNLVSSAMSVYGVYAVRNSLVLVSNSIISNKSQAISSEALSYVFSTNNAGTGNTYGLKANNGATIVQSGTQPSGTSATYTATGGVIR